MIARAALTLMLFVLPASTIREPDRDLVFDNALRDLCAQYVRWTQWANDQHVAAMDKHCNL